MEFNKEEFLKEFGGDYGYPDGPKSIEEIRNSEFKRLNGLVYLDHAGSTLYSESQMEAIFKDLTSNVYGNPHTQSDSGAATSDMLRAARQQVLDYCNASPKEYKCIFTSGTTAALKMVGEYFPWSRESCYMYTMENHNSVLGIREYALNHGAAAIPVDIEMAEEHDCSFNHGSSSIKITQHPVLRRSVPGEVLNGKPSGEVLNGSIYNLFAFPSECNFSGIKFDLNLVNAIKEHAGSALEGSSYRMGRWMVLIDAAKGGGTQPPDLARFPADFVVMSFYKIFGYPTGLGALVVRTEVTNLLKKTYFSGGTVAASVADIDYVRRRAGAEDWFEDGTPSFLSIASIHHGFKIINTLSMSSIARHTRSLATYVRRILLALRHENGAAVCVLYGRGFGKASSDDMGPTIAFNLKRPDGSWFGYREVEKLASLCGIQLRTGCFCNPGACAKYLGLSHSDLLSNIEAGRVCWDDNDILHGKPTGAVRISFGYMSSIEDAKKFISFIVSSFVSNQNPSGQGYLQRTNTNPLPSEGTGMGEVYLKSIIVYPIKSCAGFSVDSWPISNNGLQHDREWLLRSPTGQILTQKKVPEMSLISTSVNLTWGTLIVESPICDEKLQICLKWNSCCDVKEEIELNGQRYEVQGYNSEVNLWFTKAVARPCGLLRCLSPASRPCVNKIGRETMCRDVQSKLNFVNEAQILLISEESVADLNQKLSSNTQERNDGLKKIHHVSPMRFRPNLVISGAEPYAEDYWKSLVIGNGHFTSLGGCNRCQMINLDTLSGHIQKSTEPLLTLASYRRVQGRILFGILLKYERTLSECKEKVKSAGSRLQVRQRVIPER